MYLLLVESSDVMVFNYLEGLMSLLAFEERFYL